MDIKQMIYFKTIVEEGTISKAAKTLHMAQPPLSMQLKQLEEELGVTLIKRGHRKIELTQAGKVLYKRSLQMISLNEMTFHEIQDMQNEVLRIGITSSNSNILPSCLAQNQNLAHVSFRIYEGSTYEIIDLLMAHHIDLGIVRTPFDQSQLHCQAFLKDPMVAVGIPELLHSNMTHMSDYQNKPLIIHQRYLSLITDYCLNLHFHPYIKITCDDSRTSLQWAQAGLGIAIVPQNILTFYPDSKLNHVILEDEVLKTDLTLITRPHEVLNTSLQTLIELFANQQKG
jgi:hypothetical protein